MDHARILDREAEGLLLIAPLASASRARPRLRALYRDHPAMMPEAGRDAFLTGRAMVTRGMRLLGMTPQVVDDEGAVWPKGLAGAVSHGGGQVGVWLRRGGAGSLGLDLRAIGDGAQGLSQHELHLLSQQPGLARMRPEERQAGAISAKHALARALAPQLGAAVSPAALTVRASARSGISLGLADAALSGPGVEGGFRVELRVMPGLVLTRVAVGRPARLRLC
ncbi:4'-phosphopantetheinyl transferase EntD (siderophore biosynthesis) [Paracoccus alcaliphilus]|uniref:4'-phosphopantetheinyl transferase EntD (Siderophore biosynthesis) n=1 Tax=Paracoccus alcaliphilus TaxID=34002 RepID=A0A1H8ENK7_9RHOB|nr:hypothetical protein [Paracoccus alcaliphilus]WCR21009.1 hypothetical protein JHW40_22610 [Paracoccus alcaliphilus]SEN21032.1 4'-phosphopantetheinyl transferase EntD (siderophore biosynthesis) [Paracoccus alcaliphilus]